MERKRKKGEKNKQNKNANAKNNRRSLCCVNIGTRFGDKTNLVVKLNRVEIHSKGDLSTDETKVSGGC